MNDTEVKELVELLLPYIKKEIKNDNDFKTNVKRVTTAHWANLYRLNLLLITFLSRFPMKRGKSWQAATWFALSIALT